MENTKNGTTMNKALMMGTALVSLSALQPKEAQAVTQALAMSASILAPLVVAQVSALNFGDLTVSAALGTAVITTAGARSVTGGVTAVTGAGAEQAGRYSITGAGSANITVTLTTTNPTVSNGAVTMTVNNFAMLTTVGAGDPLAGAFALPAGGVVNVDVGATLNAAASQAPGTYTGTYTVNVNYQ